MHVTVPIFPCVVVGYIVALISRRRPLQFNLNFVRILKTKAELLIPSARRHIVVGGAGFLGGAMRALLKRKGHIAVGIARPSNELSSLHSDDNMVWQAVEHVSWADLLHPNDIIQYYAWGSVPGTANAEPAFDLLSNVTPIIRLLDSVRRMGIPVTIVFMSSGGTVYGETPRSPIDEVQPLMPITAYGVGKATAEHYLGFYRSLYGIDCRIVRLANPYGHGQKTGKGQGAIAAFMSRVAKGKEIEVWGDGTVVRDYLYLDDALEGILAVCNEKLECGLPIFNIGSGAGASLSDIISMLQKISGRDFSVKYKASRAFDVQYNVLKITKAKRELGWEPTVGLEAGMRRMYQAILQGENKN